MNRNDLQRLAELRLQEARALLAAELPNGAYYLAGYAIECALKACIAKRTKEYDLPDKRLAEKSFSHDLEKLLDAAGLSESMKNDLAADGELELDWDTVREWSEQLRYEYFEGDLNGALVSAHVLIDAVESEKGGVLRWIRQSW